MTIMTTMKNMTRKMKSMTRTMKNMTRILKGMTWTMKNMIRTLTNDKIFTGGCLTKTCPVAPSLYVALCTEGVATTGPPGA